MDEPVTKRLHVSGLTPSITLADLSTRLGMYGSITSLDKFGEVDALGQPRKFAYVTLETTKGKLGKCMNVLSGSTWKGAKLRIGEAKPDFRERIVRENAPTEDSDRPKKRPRLARGVQGVHAPSMDPITPSTVEEHAHKGWYVTPLGRLIRPMRMRPARPLDPPIIATTPKDKKDKKKGKVGKDGEVDEKKKTKKRKAVPDVRARRKTIDPVKHGSTHVIGAFLGGGEGAVAQNAPSVEAPAEDELSDSDESSSSSSSEGDDHDAKNDHPDTPLKNAQPSAQPPLTIPPLPKSTIPVPALAQSPPPPRPAPVAPATDMTPGDELTAEKLKSLNLLRSMFGEDEGQEDWGGAESMSDVDMDEDGNEPRGVAADGDGEEYEVVRRDGGAKLPERKMDVDDAAEEDEEEEDEETEEDEDEEDEEPSKTERGTQEKKGQPGVQITKLKDLFAPREEEAGFSLLGHLDLELDEDMDFEFGLPSYSTAAPSTTTTTTVTAAAPLISSLTTPSGIPIHQKTALSQQTLTLDPSLPLFFPTTSQTGHRNAPTNMRPGAWKDIYGFYRTDDEATIRQRWEDSKGELTREWKRRYREGLKRRRRRGGGVGDVD